MQPVHERCQTVLERIEEIYETVQTCLSTSGANQEKPDLSAWLAGQYDTQERRTNSAGTERESTKPAILCRAKPVGSGASDRDPSRIDRRDLGRRRWSCV